MMNKSARIKRKQSCVVLDLEGEKGSILFITLFRHKKENKETLWRGQEPLHLL